MSFPQRVGAGPPVGDRLFVGGGALGDHILHPCLAVAQLRDLAAQGPDPLGMRGGALLAFGRELLAPPFQRMFECGDTAREPVTLVHKPPALRLSARAFHAAKSQAMHMRRDPFGGNGSWQFGQIVAPDVVGEARTFLVGEMRQVLDGTNTFCLAASRAFKLSVHPSFAPAQETAVNARDLIRDVGMELQWGTAQLCEVAYEGLARCRMPEPVIVRLHVSAVTVERLHGQTGQAFVHMMNGDGPGVDAHLLQKMADNIALRKTIAIEGADGHLLGADQRVESLDDHVMAARELLCCVLGRVRSERPKPNLQRFLEGGTPIGDGITHIAPEARCSVMLADCFDEVAAFRFIELRDRFSRQQQLRIRRMRLQQLREACPRACLHPRQATRLSMIGLNRIHQLVALQEGLTDELRAVRHSGVNIGHRSQRIGIGEKRLLNRG